MREVIISAVRRIDPNIIDATGNQKWHRVRVHGVDLDRYGRDPGGMELIQREMEAGANSVRLVWTLR